VVGEKSGLREYGLRDAGRITGDSSDPKRVDILWIGRIFNGLITFY
jgi:hypothetical protein